MIARLSKLLVLFRNYLIYKWYALLAAIRSKPIDFNPEASFIVSIASYPKRLHLLPAVFESVARQSCLPRSIYLVLSEEEWDRRVLPRYLRRLENLGVKIVWTNENPFAVKMLLPIIELHKDLSIITLGDDWIYLKNFLENTVNSNAAHQGYITGPLGKTLYRKGEELNMYYRADGQAGPESNTNQLYLFGLGTLYPPGSLHEKVLDIDAVKRIVPGRGSDLWFWAAAIANNSKQYCLGAESIRGKVVPIPETNKTKPKEAPGPDEMNRRFQMAIDYFGIRERMLEVLPEDSKEV